MRTDAANRRERKTSGPPHLDRCSALYGPGAKICSIVAAANIGFMFLLVLGIKAEAAELKVLSAFGMQSVMGCA